MALVARPAPVPASPSVSSSKSAIRTSTLRGPVDSVTPSTPAGMSDELFSTVVSFGEQELPDHSYLQDRRGRSQERRGSGRARDTHLPVPPTSIIDSTTENFAKLLELRDSPTMQTHSDAGVSPVRVSITIITRAVRLYEAGVNILTNSQNVRGETLSFSL